MDLKIIKEEDIDPSNDDLDEYDLDLKTINFLFYYNKSWVLKIGFISRAILKFSTIDLI